jgi:hypothetical protein
MQARITTRFRQCCFLAILLSFEIPQSRAAQFPSSSPQSAAFTGGWCAQGDTNKHASISYNGAFATLTNENGDTSMGNYQGQNQIVAPGWQFVTGTLSQNGKQINWSNGTYWARCSNGGGGSGGGGGGWQHKLNLSGIWYGQGDRSQSCTIHQSGNNLKLNNQSNDNATGKIDGKNHLTTYWNGNPIAGTVTADGNRINWDNGTYWTRFRVF